MIDPAYFWRTSAFLRRWDQRIMHGLPTEEELCMLQSDWDPILVELWRLHGWSTYGNGFLVMDDPIRLAISAKPWLQRFGVKGSVFARTAWGHFFVFLDGNTLLVDPLFARLEELLVDPVTVLDAFLKIDDFLNRNLLFDVYRAAIIAIGRVPDRDECTCFVPALGLGGKIDPGTVQIQSVLPSMEILAQL